MRKYAMAQLPKYLGPEARSDNNIMHTMHGKKVGISSKDVESRSKVLAQILWDSGCRKNDAICCVMDKSPDFLISLKAIECVKGIAVPVNPERSVDYIQSFVLESGANWIIADRKAEPLLNSDFLQQNMLNLGWMDDIEMIPANCIPEFIKANIDHISLCSVFNWAEETAPVISFYSPCNSQEFRKYSFSNDQIEKFIVPILEFAGINSTSVVGGMMDCDSSSLLLETAGMFDMEARLCFLEAKKMSSLERLRNEVQRQQITHLLLESATLDELVKKSFPRSPGCPNVFTTVLWGGGLSEKALSSFKKTFPNSTVYQIVNDSEKQLTVQVCEIFSDAFQPVAIIPFVPGRYSNSRKHSNYKVEAN